MSKPAVILYLDTDDLSASDVALSKTPYLLKKGEPPISVAFRKRVRPGGFAVCMSRRSLLTSGIHREVGLPLYALQNMSDNNQKKQNRDGNLQGLNNLNGRPQHHQYLNVNDNAHQRQDQNFPHQRQQG